MFSFYVLNHVTRPEIVLSYIRETSRVLKPSGDALLHFCIKPSSSFWLPAFLDGWLKKRKERGLQKGGLWWNKGIKKASTDYQTALLSEFSEKESWNGCEVPWRDVGRTVKEAGLKISRAKIAGTGETHFVFLALHKK